MTQASIASPPLTARPLRCRSCGAESAPAPAAICGQCLGPLDPVYDPERALPDRETIAGRAPSLSRYGEWLPFDGDPTLSLDTGFTPLVDAPALARRLGVARAWIKNDAVSHPSLSFKDRVVATAINAAAAFGLDTIGCADRKSTRLNSSHDQISYAVFCLKKKKKKISLITTHVTATHT